MEDRMTVEQFLAAGHLFIDGDTYANSDGRIFTVGVWLSVEAANKQTDIDEHLYVVSAHCLDNSKSNKHPHYDMIMAKAANMDLVVFVNNYDYWEKAHLNSLVNLSTMHFPAFLCLPQQEAACLHWLNGGALTVNNVFATSDGKPLWSANSLFMKETATITIKPRTEKRWIAIRRADGCVESNIYKTKESAERYNSSNYWQVIEIEIEVHEVQ